MFNITFRNIHVEEFSFSFFLEASIVADDIGKAVTIDDSAARTVKLAGDDDRVVGHLSTVEDRTVEGVLVGAVDFKGGYSLPYTGAAPAIGEGVVGSATAGSVKSSGAAAVAGQPIVLFVDTTAQTVEALFV